MGNRVSKKTPKNIRKLLAGDSNKYLVMEDEIEYHDGEKHYNQMSAVIKHGKTGLYYRFRYNDWGSGGYDADPFMYQVFPEVVEKIIFRDSQ